MAPATWVIAQWELAARDIPEWKIAVIQDAPSEFADQFMYPGGGFALGNALGWVQIVDRMFRTGGGMARQFLGVFTGPRVMRRAVATLPVADADIALTGRRVRWFQEWIRHGPDDPYWQASDHRANVVRMPPVVYLQGGWYDFFLRGMLADYAALRTAGRTVRLLIGPWGHGRGLYTRVGMRDAFAALDAVLGDGTPPSGVRVFVTGSRRWTELPGWPPPARDTAWYLHPAGRLSAHPASAGPPSRFRYDPANPTPSIAGTAVGLSAGPADNRRLEARPDVLTFTSDPQAADLEVIGPVRVRLHVQASLAHIDLHARLCDVTQRGRSINVSDGIVRLTDADTGYRISRRVCSLAHRAHVPARASDPAAGLRWRPSPLRTQPRHRRTVRHQHTAAGQRPHGVPRRPTPLRRVATRVRLTASGWPAVRVYPATVDRCQEADVQRSDRTRPRTLLPEC